MEIIRPARQRPLLSYTFRPRMGASEELDGKPPTSPLDDVCT